MKISVVSPSNRPDGLEIVSKCLMKQTFSNNDFEWIICGPIHLGISHHIPEPKKNKGDIYNLNKAWNKLFNAAKGELIVSIVDNTEFDKDTLAKLWQHYIDNPTIGISGWGKQYHNGRVSWVDPRKKDAKFYEIAPFDMEFRLCSLPKRGIQAAGGIDEEYDKVAALSEKDLSMRMAALGYRFFIDNTIMYKFYKHEDHGPEWDKKFVEGVKLINKHVQQIQKGKRLRMNYVAR